MGNLFNAIADALFSNDETVDLQDYYESLLLEQPLDVRHAGEWKPGHIVAIVESPYYPDHGALMALWYSDVDFSLDYIPVELAWQAVSRHV